MLHLIVRKNVFFTDYSLVRSNSDGLECLATRSKVPEEKYSIILHGSDNRSAYTTQHYNKILVTHFFVMDTPEMKRPIFPNEISCHSGGTRCFLRSGGVCGGSMFGNFWRLRAQCNALFAFLVSKKKDFLSVSFLSSNKHLSPCIMLLQVSLVLELKNPKKFTRIDD